ncbi:hypothetical protein [Pseudorhodoplanes sp.]|uniref:hypothetical protein n=1 Tax=Pseudorhodoplanes sp. TaxID=1934341 RepID=UPI002C717C62|nr:hypothetical protein [Pseudorhodoplanes sp.]HWV55473.1 hypothetical protein [Pseudorhodoplanes sp.]
MYELSPDEAEVVNRATRLALHAAHRINVPDDVAERFLTREILKLRPDGVDGDRHLAETALGRLRDHVQVTESARRLATPSGD